MSSNRPSLSTPITAADHFLVVAPQETLPSQPIIRSDWTAVPYFDTRSCQGSQVRSTIRTGGRLVSRGSSSRTSLYVDFHEDWFTWSRVFMNPVLVVRSVSNIPALITATAPVFMAQSHPGSASPLPASTSLVSLSLIHI